jgi:RNA binding exosome subunit
MKYCHTITLTVFVRSEDIAENPNINGLVNSKIKEMLPLNWEKEKIDYKQTKAEGLSGNTIIIHELKMHKEKETNTFLKELISHLSNEQKNIIISEKESRLDENDDFFIRLEGTKLLKGIYELTTSGNCFHIKMNIAAFPKKREVALKIIEEIFK